MSTNLEIAKNFFQNIFFRSKVTVKLKIVVTVYFLEKKMKIDLLIRDANEIVPFFSDKPLIGEALKNITVINDGAIAVNDGKIVAVGKTAEIFAKFEITADTVVISAKGKTILPGFVDCHTHLVFGGSREQEFVNRIEKLRQTKNVLMGGGIKYTVAKTKEATDHELIELGKKRLKRMLVNGITTVEAKSGYGLDLENELRLLEITNKLKDLQDVEIETTFLGAHSVPHGFTSREYTNIVINEMIPAVAEKKLARFCDVFCEEGFFSREQSELILKKGREVGMELKIHADQLTNTYGASLAAELGVVSADHLDYAYDEGLKAMAEKGVIGVLLPTVSFIMDLNFPDARKLMDFNLPIAISTDFNPGAGYSESMSFVITLACLKLKMLPLEALAAATLNAAYATGVGEKVGSLDIGKQADIIIMDAPNHNYIPYHYGTNLVETVIKKGKIVHNNQVI